MIEQITYLLFIKRLDEIHTLEENKASALGRTMERRIFPEGTDKDTDDGIAFEDYRWSRLKHKEPGEMFKFIAERVFPWLRTLGGVGSLYAQHMDGAACVPSRGVNS